MPKAIDAFISEWRMGGKDLFNNPNIREYVDNTIENMSQLLEALSKGFNISLDDEVTEEDTAAEMMFKYIMENTKNDN
jgi:hypothetical protein